MDEKYEPENWETVTGDCLSVTLKFLYSIKPSEKYSLVHAFVISTKGITKGKKVFHAWIETPEGFVIDKANNNNYFMKKAEYYKMAQPSEVVRYSRDEAIGLFEKTNHSVPYSRKEKQDFKTKSKT